MPGGDRRTPSPPAPSWSCPPLRGGDPLLTWCEGPPAADVLVRRRSTGRQRPATLDIGEHLQTLSGRTTGTSVHCPSSSPRSIGERPRWRLRVEGVLRRGQRRDAVRAPMTFPFGGSERPDHRGMTVDVSEGGCRCVLDRGRSPLPTLLSARPPRRFRRHPPRASRPDLRPVPGVHDHVPRRGDAPACPGGPPGELSLRFIGLTEPQQDLIRRRVFARLRELRNRGLL